MHAHTDQLPGEVLALDRDERLTLTVALLDSLDGEDEMAVGQAWADGIRQRKADLQSGAATAVPWAEARERWIAS